MTTHQGACHCGKVTYEFTADIEQSISCNCSLCLAKGARMILVPKEDFKLTGGEDSLSEYNWNTGAARHFFCNNCGIYTHHKPRTRPEMIGINLGTVKDLDVLALPVKWVGGKDLSTQ